MLLRFFRVRWALTPNTFCDDWQEISDASYYLAAIQALGRARALRVLSPTEVCVQVDDGPTRHELRMVPYTSWQEATG